MLEFDRLSDDSEWSDLEFIERERTPEQIVEVGIWLHLVGLSLSNTNSIFRGWVSSGVVP